MIFQVREVYAGWDCAADMLTGALGHYRIAWPVALLARRYDAAHWLCHNGSNGILSACRVLGLLSVLARAAHTAVSARAFLNTESDLNKTVCNYSLHVS